MKNLSIICIILLFLTTTSCYVHDNKNYEISANEKCYVQYPVLNNIENQDTINNIILQEVNDIIKKYSLSNLNEENAVSYEIKHKDNETISIRFDGVIYHRGLPYPRRVFSSVSIDLETASILELNQIIDIENDDFFEYFTENANKQLKTMFAEKEISINDVFSDEKIKELLKNADVRDSTLDSLSYISDDYYVIRFRVIHALGDFWDFVFPLSDLSSWLLSL